MPYKNIEKQKEYQRLRQTKLRAFYKQTILQMYGNSCCKCGYSNIKALQLDHIVPIKRKGYASRGVDTGGALWRAVAIGKLPREDFQLLCANCHAIKTYNETH